MNKSDRIFVAGHSGMVGSAVVRVLKQRGYQNIITRKRRDLNLLSQSNVEEFFREFRPDYVLMAAGKPGLYYSTTAYKADLMYENLIIQTNIIHSAFINEVHKLIYFGCSNIYTTASQLPYKEESILGGALDKTLEPIAVAKIAGITLCESYNSQYGTDFFSLIPTNIYGPGQTYDGINSPLIPRLIESIESGKKNRLAKVKLLGSDTPKRDFLYVDDLAEASLHLLENFEGNLVLNIGTGRAYTVREVANIVAETLDYDGEVFFQSSVPEEPVTGKLLGIEKIKDLGWNHKVELKKGIEYCYNDYLQMRTKEKPIGSELG